MNIITSLIQILAATIGSFGFAILFNVRGNKLIAVTIGGCLSWTSFLLLNIFIESEPICYFIVALEVSLYAEIMARFLKSPATIFIAPSLIPLVPGASLYYTIASAFDKNTDLFVQKGLSTLALAASLAIGIIVSAVVMKLITKFLGSLKFNKKTTK